MTIQTKTATAPLALLNRPDLLLLARVHRWARQNLPCSSITQLWERGLLPGMWQRNTTAADQERAEVWWGRHNDYRLTVKVRESRYGPDLLDETVTARTVTEAVDLLVVWQILPVEFSSAFAAGYSERAGCAL